MKTTLEVPGIQLKHITSSRKDEHAAKVPTSGLQHLPTIARLYAGTHATYLNNPADGLQWLALACVAQVRFRRYQNSGAVVADLTRVPWRR